MEHIRKPRRIKHLDYGHGICYDIGALLEPLMDLSGLALGDLTGGASNLSDALSALGGGAIGAGTAADPLLGNVAANAAGAAGSGFNPFQLLAQAAQPLSGGGLPGLGGFQMPTATTVSNPSVTTTNTNSPFGIQIDPTLIGGAGGAASASSSGGFGLMPGISIAKGGAGGGNNLMITADPTYNLSTNLPGLGPLPNTPNLLQGGVQQSAMARPNMMPMPAPNSPMGMMMNTVQPIAAGGVSPQLAGIMALGQQQQQAPPGQQIIPGSAAQTGGYDQPPPPPQGPMSQSTGMMSPPMTQGPMPQGGGGVSMFAPPFMAMPLVGDSQQGQGAPVPGLRGPIGEAAPPALASGGAPPVAPQRIPRPFQVGAGTDVRPDPTLGASQQEILQKQQALSGTPSAIADKAKQDYDKAVEAAWKKYQQDTAEPEARRQRGEKGTDTALDDMQKLGTPAGLAKARKDTVDNIVNDLPPAMKNLYDQATGMQQSGKFDKAISLLHRFARAGVSGFQPFSSGALYEDDWRSNQAKTKAMAVYKAVQAEADKQMAQQIDLEKASAEQANRMATQAGADLARSQTGYNQAENQAYKSTIEAGTAAGTAISHEANILGHISNILRGGEEQENALVNQDLSRQRLNVSRGELAVNQGRLGVSQKAEKRQERDEPSLIAARKAETDYKKKLTGGAGQPAIPPVILQTMSGNTPKITASQFTPAQIDAEMKRRGFKK